WGSGRPWSPTTASRAGWAGWCSPTPRATSSASSAARPIGAHPVGPPTRAGGAGGCSAPPGATSSASSAAPPSGPPPGSPPGASGRPVEVGQELEHDPVELARPLHAGQVGGAVQDDPLGPGDAGGQRVGHGLDVEAVVLADTTSV